MSELDILIAVLVFAASFVAGFANGAAGDPLGLGRFGSKNPQQ